MSEFILNERIYLKVEPKTVSFIYIFVITSTYLTAKIFSSKLRNLEAKVALTEEKLNPVPIEAESVIYENEKKFWEVLKNRKLEEKKKRKLLSDLLYLLIFSIFFITIVLGLYFLIGYLSEFLQVIFLISSFLFVLFKFVLSRFFFKWELL